MAESEAPPRRIVSLDQFRGYTVVGMLFVNFLGGYVVVPAVFKHHNTYCSYADTIMPQFFFAVGFAFRLTFLRRLATERRLGGRPRRSRPRPGARLARLRASTTWTATSRTGTSCKSSASPASSRRPSDVSSFRPWCTSRSPRSGSCP